MHVSAAITYLNVSPERAFALSLDPEFRKAVCRATGALDYDVSVKQSDDGGADVTVARTVPANLPDFVRRLVGETVSIKQTERWTPPDSSGGRTANLVVEILGQPAKMTGTMVLERRGSGSRQAITGELKVAIPFLGRKMEPEVAKAIVAAVGKEQETGEKWLSESR